MKIVMVWRCVLVGDAARLASTEWDGIKMAVIGADIDGGAIGREDMIIVEIAQPARVDFLGIATVDADLKQPPASVEHQPLPIRRPVRRLDHLVHRKDNSLGAIEIDDRKFGTLP